MSRFFQKVLSAKEPLFTNGIRSLERKVGGSSVDVSCQADIMHRAHGAMRKLGLDTADTTPLELYRVLISHSSNKHLFAGLDDVYLIIDEEVVSFNHDDIEANKSLPFELRTFEHAAHHAVHGLYDAYEKANVSRKDVSSVFESADVTICEGEKCSLSAKKSAISAKTAPYVLCIGDIFSDVFIKLDENEARIENDTDGSKRLSLPFGSKPPYDSVQTVTSVGPSPNAGVSAARLGLRVGLMSWLGKDKTSQESLQYLAHEKIDTEPTVIQKDMVSNIYYVLRYGADRTILVKNESYSYDWKTPKTKPDWIYLSLISADSWRLHQDMLDYLDANPEIKLAFQPGTFHFKWGVKKLAKIYARSDIVVMNREEAVEVTGKSYDSLHELAEGLHALGPKYVVITDGPNGSYASYDGTLYRMPNYPDPAPPVDRTGAGDAFASTIVSALALGESIQTALTWAPINSMSVVQELGAQAGLLGRDEIKAHLAKAPKQYKLEEIKK